MKKILFFLFAAVLAAGGVEAQEAVDSMKIFYRRGYRNVDLSFRDNRAQMERFLNLTEAALKNEKPDGRQTIQQLIGQNQGVTNIDISQTDLKGFEKYARKYGVDYAITKDKSVFPPKYLVFFKARDADAMTAAFCSKGKTLT